MDRTVQFIGFADFSQVYREGRKLESYFGNLKNIQVGVSPINVKPVESAVQKLNNAVKNPIVVKVDESQLDSLNAHYKLKVKHHLETKRMIESNPIEVKTNVKQDLSTSGLKAPKTTKGALKEIVLGDFDTNKSLLQNIYQKILKGFLSFDENKKILEQIKNNTHESSLETIKQGSFFQLGQQLSLQVTRNVAGAIAPPDTMNAVAKHATNAIVDNGKRGAGILFEGITGGDLEELQKDVKQFQEELATFMTDEKIKELNTDVDKQLAKVIQSLLAIDQTWEDTAKEIEKAREIITKQKISAQSIIKDKRREKTKELGSEAFSRSQTQPIEEVEKVKDKDRIVIAVGGFAGKQGQSSHGVTQQIQEAIGDKKTGFLTVENTATDVAFDAASNPLGWVASAGHKVADMNVGKGYTPDAIEMAAKVLMAREQNPTAPIDLVGYSAGGFVVDQTLAILKELGITDVRGTALATPIDAGLSLSSNDANFDVFMAEEDPIKNASTLFQSLQIGDKERQPTMINNEIAGHGLEGYLNNDAIVERLQTPIPSQSLQPVIPNSNNVDDNNKENETEKNNSDTELISSITGLIDILNKIDTKLIHLKNDISAGSKITENNPPEIKTENNQPELKEQKISDLTTDIETISKIINSPPDNILAKELTEILETKLNAEGIRKLARYLEVITKDIDGKIKTKDQLINDIVSTQNTGNILESLESIDDKGMKSAYKQGKLKPSIDQSTFNNLLPEIDKQIKQINDSLKNDSSLENIVNKYKEIQLLIHWIKQNNKYINLTQEQNQQLQGRRSQLNNAQLLIGDFVQSNNQDIDLPSLNIDGELISTKSTLKDLLDYAEKWGINLNEQISQSLSDLNGGSIASDYIAGLDEGFRDKYKDLIVAMQEMGIIIDDSLADALEIKSPSKKAFRKAIDYIQGFINGLINRQGDLEDTTTDVFDQNVNDSVDSTLGEDNGLTAFMNSIKSAYPSVGKAIDSLSGDLMGLVDAGAKFVIFNLIVDGLKALTDQSFQTALQLENLERNLGLATGSDGAEKLAKVKKEANEVGVSFLKAADALAQFSSSTIGTPLYAQSEKIFSQIQSAVAAYGLNAQAQEGAFLAISQIASKGVVSMEELRQQLGERLPGALSVAAQSMGMEMQEFNQLVESGQLMASDFIPAFAQKLETQSFVALQTTAKSTQAEISRLENNFVSLKGELGQVSLTAFKVFAPLANTLLPIIEKNLAVILITATSLAGLMFIGTIAQLLQVRTAMQGIKLVLKGINVGLKTTLGVLSPLLAVTGIILAITLTVRSLNKTINAGTKELKAMGQSIKDLNQIQLKQKSPETDLSSSTKKYDRDFSFGNILNLQKIENTQDKLDKFVDYATLRSTRLARQFVLDSEQMNNSLNLIGESINRAYQKTKNIEIGEGIVVGNDLSEDTIAKVQERLDTLRNQKANIQLELAILSDSNDFEKINQLKQELSSVSDEITRVSTQPFEGIDAIEKQLEVVKTLIGKNQELAIENELKGLEGRANSYKLFVQELQREEERLNEIIEKRNEAIKPNNELYIKQIQSLRILQGQLAKINFTTNLDSIDRQISVIGKRINNEIGNKELGFQLQNEKIHEVNVKLNLSTQAFAQFESDFIGKLSKIDDGIKQQIADYLGVENLDQAILSKQIAPEQIEQLTGELVPEALKKAIEGSNASDLNTLVTLSKEYLTTWQGIKEQQLESANLQKEQQDNANQIRIEKRDFFRQLEDFDLQVQDYFRNRSRQLQDFEIQFEDASIQNQRATRDLVESFADMNTTLTQQIRGIDTQLQSTTEQLENLTNINSIRSNFDFGSNGILSQLTDTIEGMLSTEQSFTEQTLGLEEERFNLQQQITDYSRQIRGLAEQSYDLERERQQQLLDLTRQQEDFVLEQVRSWRDITRTAEDMAETAIEWGLSFDGIAESLNNINGTYADLHQSIVDFANQLQSQMVTSSVSKMTIGQGDLVGITGNTGSSTGPHTDIRVKTNGGYVDPTSYLNLFEAGGKSLSEYQVTSGMGMRVHPVTGQYKMHNGIDVATPVGLPITFKGNGEFLGIKNQPNGAGYYSEILLNTGEIIQLLHLSADSVEKIKEQQAKTQSLNSKTVDVAKFEPVLQLLRRGEGDYNAINFGSAGDAKGMSLTQYLKKPEQNITVGDVMKAQQNTALFAVGAYQFIPDTFKATIERMGISAETVFTRELQDRMAINLMMNRKGVANFLKGSGELTKAAQDMAKEWASVGVSYPENGAQVGASYYGGIGNNKASISPQEMQQSLKQVLSFKQNPQQGQAYANQPNSAVNVPTISSRNNRPFLPTRSPQTSLQTSRSSLPSINIDKIITEVPETINEAITRGDKSEISQLISFLEKNEEIPPDILAQALNLNSLGNSKGAVELLRTQVEDFEKMQLAYIDKRVELIQQQRIAEQFKAGQQLVQQMLSADDAVRNINNSYRQLTQEINQAGIEAQGFTTYQQQLDLAVLETENKYRGLREQAQQLERDLALQLDTTDLSKLPEIEKQLKESIQFLPEESRQQLEEAIANGLGNTETLIKVRELIVDENGKNLLQQQIDELELKARLQVEIDKRFEIELEQTKQLAGFYSEASQKLKQFKDLQKGVDFEIQAEQLNSIAQYEELLKNINTQIKQYGDTVPKAVEKLQLIRYELKQIRDIELEEIEVRIKTDNAIEQLNKVQSIFNKIGDIKSNINPFDGIEEKQIAKVAEITAKYKELNKELQEQIRLTEDISQQDYLKNQVERLKELEKVELRRLNAEISLFGQAVKQPMQEGFKTLISDVLKGTADINAILSNFLGSIADFFANIASQQITNEFFNLISPIFGEPDMSNIEQKEDKYNVALMEVGVLQVGSIQGGEGFGNEENKDDNIMTPENWEVFVNPEQWQDTLLSLELPKSWKDGLLSFGELGSNFLLNSSNIFSNALSALSGGGSFNTIGLVGSLVGAAFGGVGGAVGSGVSYGFSNLNLNYKDGGEVIPNFKSGGDILGATSLGLSVMDAMKKEGRDAVPIVANTREYILSAENNDAQTFKKLQRSGEWNRIKRNLNNRPNIENFKNGGAIGSYNYINRSSSSSSSSSTKNETTNAPVINFNIKTDNADSFVASRSRIRQREKLRR